MEQAEKRRCHSRTLNDIRPPPVTVARNVGRDFGASIGHGTTAHPQSQRRISHDAVLDDRARATDLIPLEKRSLIMTSRKIGYVIT
jgi:hypothetical protein